MPMLILIYILNYLDRNSIASARLAGLEADLGLVGSEYQLCVSILFVGYILCQVPSNMFLESIPKPSIYIGAVMTIWGIISGATAACTNFTGLLICRFFLGFIEAAYFCGALYYLSSWYTSRELSLRTAILYVGSLISGAFSGLIAAGIISGLDYAKGLRAWRWLFIIFGAITVVVAAAAIFILPDFPETTSWLSAEEKALAAYRLEEDACEADVHQKSVFRGLKLAVSDLRVWVLVVILSAIVSAASVTNFFPTVVGTLGYSSINSLLLTVPPYALSILVTTLNALHADKTGERLYHVIIPFGVALVAFIIAAATINTAARYVSMMLMLVIYAGYVVCLSWISSTVPRPPAKRAVALALINALSNATQVYTSFMYQSAMSPRYIIAFTYNSIMVVIAIIFTVILRFMLVRLNKKLEKGEDVDGVLASGSATAIGGKAALPTQQQKVKGYRYKY